MFQKKKRVRLSSAAFGKLNNLVHVRDEFKCVNCGGHVRAGEKVHHEPFGINKTDEEHALVTLCLACHDARHFRANSLAVKEKIRVYLKKLYPEKWEDIENDD